MPQPFCSLGLPVEEAIMEENDFEIEEYENKDSQYITEEGKKRILNRRRVTNMVMVEMPNSTAPSIIKFKRRRIDVSIEKTIITGMIVSKEILAGISEFTKPSYFQQPHLGIISGWVQDFYNQYKTAPLKNIEVIYNLEKGNLRETDAELISDLLIMLSDEYENDEREINANFVIEKALEYFKQQSLNLRIDEIKKLNDTGRFEEAKALYESYTFNKYEVKKFIEIPTFTDIIKSDITLEWVWERLIPRQTVTVIHGSGGIGKTWLGHQLGIAISNKETHFLGYEIKHERVYYIDFENPLPAYLRAKFLGESNMLIWHSSNENPPPKMDTDQWVAYKQLPPGLIIFDTLRSCQNLDENNSKDMSLIMNRFKELRDLGFTVIILHHTPKSDKGTYKGSTAIQDLCDHLLSMDYEGDVIKLGVPKGGKTRYLPHTIYLTLEEGQGLVVSEKGSEVLIEKAVKILSEFKTPPSKGQFCKAIENTLYLKTKKATDLIREGEGVKWYAKQEKHNKFEYHLIGERVYKVNHKNENE
jgi:archaellum biogenesis ATPase FlaH